MPSTVNSTAALVTDYVGIMLSLTILFSKGWNLPTRKRESRIIFFLIIASVMECVIDAVIFYIDGKPGEFYFYVSFIGNTILYLYNLVVGVGFLYIVVTHINRRLSKFLKIMVWIISFVELLLLVVNFFTPVVFSVDEYNIYKRENFYIVFVIMAFVLLLFALGSYVISKIRGAAHRYFPVWEFLLPIMVGVGLQTIVYGVSLQPVSFTIAFCGMVICLQNESLYIDKLTGVYNRYELDKIKESLSHKRNGMIAAIMIDMNDFKSINDNYSHSEGDIALTTIAGILWEVVQNNGVVIRFAGDEFVIIINDARDDMITEYRKAILVAVEEYNKVSGKPYKLSVAIGESVFDLKTEGVSEFLNEIDKLMYDDKNEYYKTHDRRRYR